MASLAEDASSPPALDDLYNHSGSSEEDGDDGDFQSGTELLTSVSVMKRAGHRFGSSNGKIRRTSASHGLFKDLLVAAGQSVSSSSLSRQPNPAKTETNRGLQGSARAAKKRSSSSSGGVKKVRTSF